MSRAQDELSAQKASQRDDVADAVVTAHSKPKASGTDIISATMNPKFQAQFSSDSVVSSLGVEVLKRPMLTPEGTEKIISSLEAMSPGISSRLGWSFLSSVSHKPSSEQETSVTELSTPITGTPIASAPFSSIFKGLSASPLATSPSISDGSVFTPQRGISLETAVSLPDVNLATPPVGVSGRGTPQNKPSGKDSRVSVRSTKRTKSDESPSKAGRTAVGGAGTRPAKRPKSESNTTTLKKSFSTKAEKRNLGSVQACVRDLGRWRATDDVLLISAVEQTNDLAAVHAGVKFSCKFTLKEIEARWLALLYDKHVSKLSAQAILALQPSVLASETQPVPWSDEEEALLSTVPTTHLGELKTFQTLLEDNISTFHSTRSPRALQYHWALMRHFCLLCDQDVGHVPADVNLTSFNEWEEELDDAEIMKPRTPMEEALDQELIIADRTAKREISFLEKDIQKWEQVLGIQDYQFPPGVTVVFRGQSSTYEMRTKEIAIGRGSIGGEKVDIDLMHEMPNNKVSRKQALVKFDRNGDLVLRNIGRRAIYAHGRPVLPGQSTKLEHRHILEICGIVLTVYMRPSSQHDKSKEPSTSQS